MLEDCGRVISKTNVAERKLDEFSDSSFGSGAKELLLMGKNTIQELTLVLSKMEGKRFQIEGHTDNDQGGVSNWEIAAYRALSIASAMVKTGLSETKISAASFGDSKPIVSNDSPKNKAYNRRIEVVILPTYNFLSGY